MPADWTPPPWWPDAYALLSAGAGYSEAADTLGIGRNRIRAVDARLGYPGTIPEDETERGPACLCCGRSAPREEMFWTRMHPTPLCERCGPLGRAASILRERDGLPWVEIADRLQYATGDRADLRRAKINQLARAWQKRQSGKV